MDGERERFLIGRYERLAGPPGLSELEGRRGPWTLVLLPQLHSELDDCKRDVRTRDAAQKVINQIEDFDRRGDRFVGVPLAGKLTVREVPISPDMSQTLSLAAFGGSR